MINELLLTSQADTNAETSAPSSSKLWTLGVITAETSLK